MKHLRAETRWRGRLPVPRQAHPLVRCLITALNEQKTTLREVAERAGISPATVSGWRYRSVPNLVNFEAAINVLDLELRIVPRALPKGKPDV